MNKAKRKIENFRLAFKLSEVGSIVIKGAVLFQFRLERKRVAKGREGVLTLHPLEGCTVALKHGFDGEAGVVGLGVASVGRTKA